MKNILKLPLITLLVSLLACHSTPSEKELGQLNGYWEIKEVTTQYGKDVNYTLSTTVDYIELDEGLQGFRVKVQPQLDGNYIRTGTQERLRVKQEDNRMVIYYTTPEDQWKEMLLRIDDNSFSVKNPSGNTYTYQRFNGYLSHEKE